MIGRQAGDLGKIVEPDVVVQMRIDVVDDPTETVFVACQGLQLVHRHLPSFAPRIVAQTDTTNLADCARSKDAGSSTCLHEPMRRLKEQSARAVEQEFVVPDNKALLSVHYAALTRFRNLLTSILSRLISDDSSCAAERTWVDADPVSAEPRCTSTMSEDTRWVCLGPPVAHCERFPASQLPAPPRLRQSLRKSQTGARLWTKYR